jgi:glutamine amidotransferase
VTRVQLVDYDAGNMFSIHRALMEVGADVRVVSGAEDWDPDIGHVVLPGVGAFGHGMGVLRAHGLDVALRDHAVRGRPLMGVCLGAQLLFERSEEFGSHEGLGLLPGAVRRIPADAGRVPHVGWAPTELDRPDHPLLGGYDGRPWFYFVHSFMFEPSGPGDLLAHVRIGPSSVAAAAGRDSVVGVQFHPERSGPVGIGLLRRFLAWGGDDA